MKRISLLIPIVLLLLTPSCSDDFLERASLGTVDETNFLNTGQDAIPATNAVYNTLRLWHYHGGGFSILDIMSDDAVKGSNPGDAIPIRAFDDFTYTPDQATILNWYATLYQGVRRANTVIEKLPPLTDIDAGLKNRLLAEVRFLRALFYFDLVRGWGDVPKITSIVPPDRPTRAPKEEIYRDIILPDLEFAASTLPERSDYPARDLGRATRGAAKALLARVYLFRGDFANAERWALEVIQSGEYSLDPDYSNAFSVTGEFGPGSVFEIGALPEGSFELGGNQYGNTQAVRGSPNRGWGFNRPSYDLITFFPEEDPRLDATVVFLGEEIDGVRIMGDGSTPDTTYTDASRTQIAQIEAYNQKVWVPGTTAETSWGHNRRLIRYADVLLMAAEALNENGNQQDALLYLNRVRARARGENPDILPDITTTDQGELRQAIYEERRAELAMEGLRFHDLVRTGRAAAVLGPLGFEEGQHELLPIPQSEIDISQGSLTQNPNW
ncbi:RagB/SusD family nutrient uptake outer membrane protein [Cesiribacter andamanensis]|uniref:SusD family protein n=1 Tax=Cesiribacter andamanensis AMV16 TaxID=1279009 RepID=M7NX40_9BACT|nr:RagB/SusD family nutrient uptake outer membrane protein [Cesiribacter andamanensis]EMR03014.1 SusD family protein [Cesiribacter andamanensis AMV16]